RRVGSAPPAGAPAGPPSAWPRRSAALWDTTWCRSRALPSTSITIPSSDAASDARRGAHGPWAHRPDEPGTRADGEQDDGAPLEPALAVDELRLEEVDGDAELEEAPVVDARLEPARRALDLPERIARDAGRDPDTARRRYENPIAARGDALNARPGPLAPLEESEPRHLAGGRVARPEEAGAGRVARRNDDGADAEPPGEPVEGVSRQALPRLPEEAVAVELLGESHEPRRRGGLAGGRTAGAGVVARPGSECRPGRGRGGVGWGAGGGLPGRVFVEADRRGDEEDPVGPAAKRVPEPIQLMAGRDLLEGGPLVRRGPDGQCR